MFVLWRQLHVKTALYSCSQSSSLCFVVSEPPRPAELKRWLELEGDIKRVVEDHWEVEDIVDDDGEHVEFQGDVNEALEL